jgi:capsular exopolysaccharide synthesis family protein
MSTAAPTVQRPMTSAGPRPAAPAAAASGGVALDPIRLLKKYYPLLIAAAVVGAALGAAAHFVLARTNPQFTASAVFEIRPQAVRYDQPTMTYTSQDELLRFIGTQMATLVSFPVLERVARDAAVEKTKWASQFVEGGAYNPRLAQAELEKDLVVRPVPQSNLMRLTFTWKDPEDTRTIVETVTKVYLEDVRRQQSVQSVAQRSLLTEQITLLDSQIKELNTSRDRLMQDNQVTSVNVEGGTSGIRTERINAELVVLMGDIEQQRSLLKSFEDKRNQPVPDYPDSVREAAKRDPTVQGLDAQISNGKTDLDSLARQGYGAEHPTVIAVRKRQDALESQREEAYQRELVRAFDGQIDSLRLGVDGLEARMKALRTDLEGAEKRAQDLARVRLRMNELEREIDTRSIERANLQASLKTLDVLGNNVFDRVRLLVPAQRPGEMSFPKLAILVPIGALLITALAAGVVLLREVFDQRVRGPADLSVLSRLRVLGMVSDAGEDPSRPGNLALTFRDNPRGVTSESFRLLRSPVEKAMDQHGHKTLLVLGGAPGSGATTVVCNLALACAGAEERTLVIDGNLRRPAIHRVFNVPEGPGLGDVLAGAARLDECLRPSGVNNLTVVTAGTAGNRAIPERLGGESMARLLAEACGKFDRIIIDSAPAIVSGDGMALANRAHASLLVVRAMAEKRGLVNRVRNQLAETRSEFLGVVVNAVRASAGGYLRGNIKATHEYQASGSPGA